MEAISNNDSDPVRRSYSRAARSAAPVVPAASDPATDASLTDVGKIADRASRAGEEIRPEAIERAKALLANPNWPNDEALEGLAEKLLSSDDFSS